MEKLTLQARINGLLKRLNEQYALVTVTFEECDLEFTSSIIEFNPDNGYLILDELKPAAGNKLLQERMTCQVRAHVDGISLNFPAPILEYGEKDGYPCYKTTVPDTINYLQRRIAYRVITSAAHPIEINLTTKDKTTIKGIMADISTGGLRAKFSDDVTPPIALGDILACQFVLEETEFNVDIIVRIINPEAQPNYPAYIGGQFTGLLKSQERLLQKAVMTLERSARKRQAQ